MNFETRPGVHWRNTRGTRDADGARDADTFYYISLRYDKFSSSLLLLLFFFFIRCANKVGGKSGPYLRVGLI